MRHGLHLNLDDAWETGILNIPTRDLRAWGKKLRYIARKPDVEAFHHDISDDLADFILYGSATTITWLEFCCGELPRRQSR